LQSTSPRTLQLRASQQCWQALALRWQCSIHRGLDGLRLARAYFAGGTTMTVPPPEPVVPLAPVLPCGPAGPVQAPRANSTIKRADRSRVTHCGACHMERLSGSARIARESTFDRLGSMRFGVHTPLGKGLRSIRFACLVPMAPSDAGLMVVMPNAEDPTPALVCERCRASRAIS
jgi:hypothetical protein